MTASLLVRSLTVYRGPKLVLDDIDLTLAPGRRIGLVGPNGVGKSTLLRALSGELVPDGGSVERAPVSATIGLLPQEPSRSSTETIWEFLQRRTGVTEATALLETATNELAAQRPGSDDLYSDAFERWMALGGADLESRAGRVWADLGLDADLLDQPTSTLSGGEAARATLASLMLSQFDVFLLDEPTNDLDLDGLRLLEQWMVSLSAPVLVVSHDRTFLERTITDVCEIDFHSHRATFFAGGWDAFQTERERAAQLAQRKFDDYASEKSQLAQRAQQQREWASQGQSKVRKSDENDKHVINFKMNQTEQLAGKAAQTARAAERLEVVEKPWVPWELQLEIPVARRSGDEVAWTRNAVVNRDPFVLGPVTTTITFGDRVALVGENGSGKTTLINLLLGRLQPDSGTAGLGPGVIVGEIEQARTELGADEGLGQGFEDATGMTTAEARTLLAKFGLVAEHVSREVGSLSPGERTRAALALLMANGANLLVLDEPTNHLDLPAIEQLEQAIDTFNGTVILITHDRLFLDRFRPTRTLRMTDGQLGED